MDSTWYESLAACEARFNALINEGVKATDANTIIVEEQRKLRNDRIIAKNVAICQKMGHDRSVPQRDGFKTNYCGRCLVQL